MNKIYRMLDAQINRAVEGIRVLEDLVRFEADRGDLSKALRDNRHLLRKTFLSEERRLLAARQSEFDLGKAVSENSQNDKRSHPSDLLTANARRAQEALRGVEESAKAIGLYEKGKICEQIRFELYSLHQKLEDLFVPQLPKGLYCITDEKFSNNRDALFQVAQMCQSGIKVIQYREKYREKKEKYKFAKEIRKITSDSGVMLILNDDVDIAVLIGADGVHIGQEDMPLEMVRRLVGPRMMVGLSTHSKEQLNLAVEMRADYVGVGPIYPTRTKEHVCAPVGLNYLEQVVDDNRLSFVAIGGIKKHNLLPVLERGAETVCLVSAITSAADIKNEAKQMNEFILNYIEVNKSNKLEEDR